MLAKVVKKLILKQLYLQVKSFTQYGEFDFDLSETSCAVYYRARRQSAKQSIVLIGIFRLCVSVSTRTKLKNYSPEISVTS